ncbi:MAG TPA: TauD/TfdA family dioxygenase, partial [Burkholderiales bacterium]|nr:TauD/TfdA family dioxygenase [Burkholderiales bacterium]
MSITVSPVTPEFVAEVFDVDLTRPILDADFAAIANAFWKYAVLIFPNQDITQQQQLAFAERFGPVERERTLDPKATPSRFDGAFSDISNLTAEGKIWAADSRQRMYKAGNKLWHTDSSFKYLPALTSLLHARTTVPIGGHTEFADQRAAYDALTDAERRQLEGLIVEHWIVTSRKRSGFSDFNADEQRRLPPVPQMLV